ncbi:hypothetical protein SYNPS1DRAFT_28936 [Syncephalis pseudoplumigaleata]|uniref:Chitin-binding type-4 domain-containing protein n=1 Tax=Syncephalis pseudoplumigaleata TaxID=1712513 RepID=A0A4P9YZB1_9FUNG|nr:hypothetical protein SYNPS1DRAFT_28936 [Syncephalis pseudoplumigaleata]|eukprot:RKP25328.1 hypothetical protein SYNPS1DRAFT_28936 [Syncephalis pseudoplumigaleata]
MTRLTAAFGTTLGGIALLALTTVSSVQGHGFLTYPVPRGIEKMSYQIDDIKNPNTKGICRGETKPGKINKLSGSVTLKFNIFANHIGPCTVSILDENMSELATIATKDGCAASKPAPPWTVNIPAKFTGRKILRWHWKATHLGEGNAEHFEQCADIDLGGGGGGGDGSDSGSSDNDKQDAPSGGKYGKDGGDSKKDAPADEKYGGDSKKDAPADEKDGGNDKKDTPSDGNAEDKKDAPSDGNAEDKESGESGDSSYKKDSNKRRRKPKRKPKEEN